MNDFQKHRIVNMVASFANRIELATRAVEDVDDFIDYVQWALRGIHDGNRSRVKEIGIYMDRAELERKKATGEIHNRRRTPAQTEIRKII